MGQHAAMRYGLSLALLCDRLCVGSGGGWLHVGEYCHAEVFRASCAEDQVVLMERALYGRMSLTSRCALMVITVIQVISYNQNYFSV